MFGIDGLTLLSGAALAFALLTYVLLDGTDLGVGLLMGSNPRPDERATMVLSILPVWDANETWLVLAAGGLLALFPAAYAILLPALYLPLSLMLMALILRAVGLEFREQVSRKRLADGALLAGSLLATVCQGIALGTLLQGVPQAAGQYAGSGWEWLSPFPLACGLALTLGYLWLGACWLYWRCDGALQRRSGRQARWLAVLVPVLLIAMLAWAAAFDARYAARLYHPWLAAPALLVLLALSAGFQRALHGARDHLPLFAALGMVCVSSLVLVIMVFPSIVPPDLSLGQAHAAPATQWFMLVGFMVIVPVTLAYNTWGFRVFAGKIRS
ncbi:cytochrome d ubiquinol oxidase subunit II [Pseudomonas sp. Marseille-QA0332]